MKRMKKIIICLFLSVGLSGCHIYRAYERPDEVVADSLYRQSVAAEDTVSLASLSWKELFTDPGFRRITADAKILYGLMLDRMGLSIRNNWLDEQERVFIYFSLEEAMDALCCGHNKAVSLFTELDKVGLIERKKQGQGRPTKIYVKNFIRKEEVKTSENRKSALPETGTLDFRKSDTINTNKNKTDLSDTDPSIYPAQAPPDGYDRFGCRKQLYEKLDYEILITEYGETSVKSIIELLTDTLCTAKPSVRIGGEEIPIAAVRERLGQLDRFHITYVLDCMQRTSTPIRNIRAYLLAALYQAPTTIDSYYRAAVRADCGR